jgi:hypothetical protein
MQRTPFLVVAAFATALMGHAGEMPDFSGLDTDADGRLSEAEFVSWKTSGGRATESEAVAKFTKFDADQDGLCWRRNTTPPSMPGAPAPSVDPRKRN